jgi:hypothetical protein
VDAVHEAGVCRLCSLEECVLHWSWHVHKPLAGGHRWDLAPDLESDALPLRLTPLPALRLDTQNVLVEIDGNRSMDTVFSNITAVLDSAKASKDPLEAFCQEVPEAEECRVYE